MGKRWEERKQKREIIDKNILKNIEKYKDGIVELNEYITVHIEDNGIRSIFVSLKGYDICEIEDNGIGEYIVGFRTY